MAWATATSATQLTTVTTQQFFDTLITTDGPEIVAHCQVDIDFGATPADAIVNVYSTLDASSENWDDTPLLSFLVDKDTDPNALSFTIAGVHKFRVGVSTTGTALTTADLKYRTG